VLCGLSRATCSKGIIVSGISQGAELAVLSANDSFQVKAVYALSDGDQFDNINNLKVPCMGKANTKIPGNRLTIIDGQSDPYFGGQSNVQNVSGFVCPNGSFQCWRPEGSGAGWYIVQNWQNTNGIAGHCYFMDAAGVYACSDIYDVNWRPPATYLGRWAPTWIGSRPSARIATFPRKGTRLEIGQGAARPTRG
jgi:hypothetical protein